MDLKKLEYLETIYRLRSFSKAAEEHYISQPSISNAIQKLETDLGVLLIDRNSKPLSFTPEGVRFMSHVYNILDAVTFAERDMKGLLDASAQIIRLSAHSTLNDWILTRLFSDFQDRYPQYHLQIDELTNQLMLEQLLTEDIDLVYSLIPETCDLEKYETIPVQSCELYVLLPKKHPLERYDRIPLSSLKSERIITFPKGSMIRECLEQEFEKIHIAPRIQSVNQIRFIQNLVEQNIGLSFVTVDETSLLTNTDTFSIRPLQTPIHFMKGFILKRDRRRTAAIDCIISYVMGTVQESRIARRKETP